MNNCPYICFDFETSSPDPFTCLPLSLSAQAYNSRTLKPITDASFNAIIRPNENEWDMLTKGAEEIHGLTPEILREKGLDRKGVWKEFCQFVNRFNRGGTVWNAPVPIGMNIKNFDMPIIERLAKEFDGPLDKEGRCSLFNRRFMLDLLDVSFLWFENQAKPAKYNLGALLEHLGLSTEGAHTSSIDVENAGNLLMRYLTLHRTLYKRVTWRQKEEPEPVAV